MLVRCPNCAQLFAPPAVLVIGDEDVPVGRLTFADDGTAYRELRDGEERHIDQRVRCPACAFHQR